MNLHCLQIAFYLKRLEKCCFVSFLLFFRSMLSLKLSIYLHTSPLSVSLWLERWVPIMVSKQQHLWNPNCLLWLVFSCTHTHSEYQTRVPSWPALSSNVSHSALQTNKDAFQAIAADFHRHRRHLSTKVISQCHTVSNPAGYIEQHCCVSGQYAGPKNQALLKPSLERELVVILIKVHCS